MTTGPSRTGSKDPRPNRSGAALTGSEAMVLALFLLSGASALVYEVVWSRQFTFVFGGTASAIATVLAAYMAGLALGSWAFGRRIDRRGHPLVVYALLEAGIAAWAVILPLVLLLLDALYGFLYRALTPGPLLLSLIRFALSFLTLLIPTTLMGGTLPVLSRLLVGDRAAVGLKAGLLYGINTVGAVIGTAVAGFFLIPLLGMRVATAIAIVFNLIVAGLALLLARRLAAPDRDEPRAAAGGAPADRPARGGDSPGIRRAALVLYALSGFAALTYEVAWTKVLSGALGTTTYAFSAMLTTFLLGLSLGAILVARFGSRVSPARLLLYSQLLIAALALAAIPLFGDLPILFVDGFRRWGGAWGAQTLSRFLLCAVTMLPPTLLMGAAFPLVARLYVDETRSLGREVGELYAANTIGAILGSFLAGFVLIPLVGRQTTILTAVGVNILSALVLGTALIRERALPRGAAITAGALAAAVAILLVPGLKRWDPYLMSSGAYVYADVYAKEKDIRAAMHESHLVRFKEEAEAILSVGRTEHVLSLRTNGKVEASTSLDMLTQKMVSHLPLFYHDGPSDVLMIGLASGISFGAVLSHPDVKHADCVEMLRGMKEMSEEFRSWNHDCLADPRARLVINDGRNYLKMSDRRYDVIVSQPSNPWIVGIGSLFTREFFTLGAKRLNPHGIFCQWVQTYQMSRRDFGSILRTFHEAFPHVVVWMGIPGDVILLGSADPLTLPWDRMTARLSQPTVAADLADVDVKDPASLLVSYLGAEATCAALTAAAGPVITDDNLLLEFSMPRNLYNPKTPMMDVGLLVPARSPITDTITPPAGRTAFDTTEVALFDRVSRGRALTLTGVLSAFGGQQANAIETLERAHALLPEDPVAVHYLSQVRNDIALQLLQSGQTAAALDQFRHSAKVGSPSERALALNNLGLQFFSAGEIDSALVLWQEACDLEPLSPIIQYNVALALENLGRPAEAVAHYRAIVAVEPDNAPALNNLAWILAQDEKSAGEAVTLARRAVGLDPAAGNKDTLGWALFMTGQKVEAESLFRALLADSTGNFDARYHLARLLAGNGRAGEARPLYEEVVRRAGDLPIAAQARQGLEALK